MPGSAVKPFTVFFGDEWERFKSGLGGLDPRAGSDADILAGRGGLRPGERATITIPGWSQVIKVGPRTQIPAGAMAEFYRAQREKRPPNLPEDVALEIAFRQAVKEANRTSAQPAWARSWGQIMTAIDNVQDFLSTLATLGRLFLWAAPRVGARLLPGIGWVILAADILNLMNFLGMVAMPLYSLLCNGPREAITAGMPAAILKNALCREVWTMSRLNPFSRQARALRKLRALGRLPGIGNLIEVAQTADNLFGYGLSIGARYGMVMEALFAAAQETPWGNVEINTNVLLGGGAGAGTGGRGPQLESGILQSGDRGRGTIAPGAQLGGASGGKDALGGGAGIAPGLWLGGIGTREDRLGARGVVSVGAVVAGQSGGADLASSGGGSALGLTLGGTGGGADAAGGRGFIPPSVDPGLVADVTANASAAAYIAIIQAMPPEEQVVLLQAAGVLVYASAIAGKTDLFPDTFHLDHMAALVGAVPTVATFFERGPAAELMADLLPRVWRAPTSLPRDADLVLGDVAPADVGVGSWWIEGNPEAVDGDTLIRALGADTTRAVSDFLKPRRNRADMAFYGATLNQVTDHLWSMIGEGDDALRWQFTPEYTLLTTLMVEGLLVRESELEGPLWRFWQAALQLIEARGNRMLERSDLERLEAEHGVLLLRVLPPDVPIPDEWEPFFRHPERFLGPPLDLVAIHEGRAPRSL